VFLLDGRESGTDIAKAAREENQVLVKGPLGIHLDLRPDYNSRSQLKDALRNALAQAINKEGMEQSKQKIRVMCPRMPDLGATPDQIAKSLIEWLPRAHQVFRDVFVSRRINEVDAPNTLEEILTALTSYGSR